MVVFTVCMKASVGEFEDEFELALLFHDTHFALLQPYSTNLHSYNYIA